MSIADKLLQIAENEQKVYNAGYAKGKAEVVPSEPVLQEATFTENGEYLPDEGYDGFGKVTVDVEGGGVVEELLTPHSVHLDTSVNGFQVTPGKLVFDLEGGFYGDTAGYTTYFYAIGDVTSKLTLTGVKLYNAFPDGTTRENVVFIKNTLIKDAVGMPLYEYVMTSHDVVVRPDPWDKAEPPSKYIIDVPHGLGIDGIAFSCYSSGTPVLKSVTSYTYNEGYNDGYSEGYGVGHADGIVEGKQAEYDAFWDAFQDYGNPKDYGYVFAYSAFTDETYNPKYPINCTPYVAMSGQYVFTYSKITNTKVPVICGANRDMSGVFSNSKIETIPKFVVHETNTFGNAFQNCTSLKNITIDGVVANNISFTASSLLSRESIESIITHLSDTASGKTVKLSMVAVDAACAEAEFSESINHTNSGWWAALIATKSNWTISLA